MNDREERRVTSRNDMVLAYLTWAARQQIPWVSTADLSVEHIGGTGARTRISNLRAAGHRIESRRRDGSHQHEYRYLGPPGEVSRAPRRRPTTKRRAPEGRLKTLPLF